MSIGRSRRGMSSLVMVLGLLAVLALVTSIRHERSLEAAGGVHRARMAALARLQARSAIQECLQVVAREADESGTALHDRLRSVLGTSWSELDLGDLVDLEPARLDPVEGRLDAAAAGSLSLAVTDLEVKLRSPRPLPGTDLLDEWTAVLTLGATASVTDARRTVRQRVEESYELRMVRVGLPRPFDQVSFLAGRTEAVLDAAAVERLRLELLAIQPRVIRDLLPGIPAEAPEATRSRLQAILDGLVPADEQGARTPSLPSGPSLLLGFDHTRAVYLPDLGLVRGLQDRLAEAREREAEVRVAAPGSETQVEALYALVDAYSRGLEQIWLVARMARFLPYESEGFATLRGWLDRLSPENLAARVTLAGSPEHPLIAAWLAGSVRLDGVIDLRSAREPLLLRGELHGRVMILAGPAGVRLEGTDRHAGARGDRLVVVSCGGDLEVSGEVRAQLVLLGEGRARLEPGARLAGALLAPDAGPGRLELEGWLLLDPRVRAPERPADAAGAADGAGYVVSLSPEPLFVEGVAR